MVLYRESNIECHGLWTHICQVDRHDSFLLSKFICIWKRKKKEKRDKKGQWIHIWIYLPNNYWMNNNVEKEDMKWGSQDMCK